MKKLFSMILAACMSLSMAGVYADDMMKKDDMGKGEMKKEEMKKDDMGKGEMKKPAMKHKKHKMKKEEMKKDDMGGEMKK